MAQLVQSLLVLGNGRSPLFSYTVPGKSLAVHIKSKGRMVARCKDEVKGIFLIFLHGLQHFLKEGAVGNPPGRAFSKAGEFVCTVEFIKAFAARKFFNILPDAQAAIPELGPVAHLLHDGADAEAVDGIPVLSHDIVDVKANIGKACNESIEARHGPRTVCEELVRMGPVRFKEFPR